MKKPIYLDHHASTPLDPRVLEAMLPFLKENFGNASSEDHVYGWEASEAVDRARLQVANLIQASPKEIIFTSGATESSNIAWLGLAKAYPGKKHIVTTAIEHASILETAKFLETSGFEITYLPVNHQGLISLEDLEKAIRPGTLLVSVQMANNEVGTLQPISEIGKICKRTNVFFHTDAVQALAFHSVHVNELGIDLMSISAHKMYGPKGIGALYIRSQNPRVNLEAIYHGGHQERGLRPGTLNVPSIVGFGLACKICEAQGADDRIHVSSLRDFFLEKIKEISENISLNGSIEHRLANNLHLSFGEIEAENLIHRLKTIALSTGAACASGKRSPSHVLKAMGLENSAIHSSIRFGLGRFTTLQEIESATAQIAVAVHSLEEKTHG